MAYSDPASLPRKRFLIWTAFLAVWVFSQILYGGVAPWVVATTTMALAVLNLIALGWLPGRVGHSRSLILFLVGGAVVFALQLLPLPLLFPFTTALRTAHGTGSFWPGTADTFLTVRALTQYLGYVLAGFLVIILRGSGLTLERILRDICLVLMAQGVYGIAQECIPLDTIPFFGPRVCAYASGTLVNRNSFAGLMGMSLAIAMGLMLARFSPLERRRQRWEAGMFWGVAVMLFALCVVLSRSRGGAIAALTGVVAFPLLLRGRASMIGAIALSVVGSVGVVAANPSVLVERFDALNAHELQGKGRFAIWATTLDGVAQQPLLGFGVGTYPRAYHPFQPPHLRGQISHAHNEAINALFEGGALWLTVLFFALGAWFLAARRHLSLEHGSGHILTAATQAAVIVILVHSFVDFDLRITAVGLLFAMLLGMNVRVDTTAASAVWPVTAVAGLIGGMALVILPLNPTARATETSQMEMLTRRALALSPYDHEAAWTYARMAQSRGETALAGRRLATAADLWPAHPDLQHVTGRWFWNTFVQSRHRTDLERAGTYLKRFFIQTPEAIPDVMKDLWTPERPTEEYEALIPDMPASASALAIFLVHKDNWADALSVFERRCPAQVSNAPLFDAFAATLQSAGQWGIEATLRDRRLAIASDAEAYTRAADAWLRLGAHDMALERTDMALRIEPSNPRWYLLKADALEAKGDLWGALEMVSTARTLAPADLSWLQRRAALYMRLDMWPNGVEDLRELSRKQPEDRATQLDLARALLKSNEGGEAQRVLQQWLASHPRDPDAEQLLKSFPKEAH